MIESLVDAVVHPGCKCPTRGRGRGGSLEGE